MPRLRSDDPVSQAIATSFLDFLQHNLQLANDADEESLAVAIECLAAIFRLDPAAFSTPRQPELLPHIFRMLLSQGLGGSVQGSQQLPESGQHHSDGGQYPNTASVSGGSQQPGNASSGDQRSGGQGGSEGEVHGANAAREALLAEDCTEKEPASELGTSALPTTPAKVRPQGGEEPSTPQQAERGPKASRAAVQEERLADGTDKGGAAAGGNAEGCEDANMAEAEGAEDSAGAGRRRDPGKEKVNLGVGKGWCAQRGL